MRVCGSVVLSSGATVIDMNTEELIITETMI